VVVVAPSSISSSASRIAALPIVKPKAVITPVLSQIYSVVVAVLAYPKMGSVPKLDCVLVIKIS